MTQDEKVELVARGLFDCAKQEAPGIEETFETMLPDEREFIDRMARAAIAALSTVEEPTTGDAVKELLEENTALRDALARMHNERAALAQSQPTPDKD